jgi:hypothetical protein
MQRLLTLFACCALSAISLSAQSATPLQDSPEAAIHRFLRLASGGDLQTPKGWEQANLLFVHPTPMPEAKSTIIMGEDYTVREVWTRGSHAQVVVTYRNLGTIDSSLHYSAPDPRISKVEQRYQLIRAGAPIGAEVKGGETSGALGWRIQNPHAVFFIGPIAASQYLSLMSESANSPMLKRNADAALQRLKTLH